MAQTFKQWQQLNEHLFPLGISQRQVVGGIVGNVQGLDEKQKHCGCDDAERPDDDHDEEDRNDDEKPEEDDAEELRFSKKKMKKNQKKNMKKKMHADCDDDDEDDDEDDKDDNWEDDDEDGDNDDEEHPEEYNFQKKNMKKNMKKKMDAEKCKKCGKKMKSESNDEFLRNLAKDYALPHDVSVNANEKEFFQSLANQFGNPHAKYNDGLQEDFLLAPPSEQKNSEPDADSSPKPGEVGYAPTGRLDMFTPTSRGDYQVGESEDHKVLRRYFGEDIAKNIIAKRKESWMQH